MTTTTQEPNMEKIYENPVHKGYVYALVEIAGCVAEKRTPRVTTPRLWESRRLVRATTLDELDQRVGLLKARIINWWSEDKKKLGKVTITETRFIHKTLATDEDIDEFVNYLNDQVVIRLIEQEENCQ